MGAQNNIELCEGCLAALSNTRQRKTSQDVRPIQPHTRTTSKRAAVEEGNNQATLLRKSDEQGYQASHGVVTPDADILGSKPAHFASLNEARSSLVQASNQLNLDFLNFELDDQYYGLAMLSSERRPLFVPWLHAWEDAFHALLLRIQPRAKEFKAAMVLKANHLVAEIFAQVDLSLGEFGWDAFHGEFKAVVDLAVAVIEGSKHSDNTLIEPALHTGDVFTLSFSKPLTYPLSIVDPLYEVVARCRDATLRREALKLLCMHPRQEYMRSSSSAWKMNQILVRMEGQGAGARAITGPSTSAGQHIPEQWSDFVRLDDNLEHGSFGDKQPAPHGSAM